MNKLTYVLFHKVSWEQLSGEVGDFVANLLQYLYANNYRNIIQFDKYNTVWQSYCKYKKGAIFIAPQCRPITVRVQLFSVAEKMSRISHEIPVNRLPYKIKRRQFWSCLCQLPMIMQDIYVRITVAAAWRRVTRRRRWRIRSLSLFFLFLLFSVN